MLTRITSVRCLYLLVLVLSYSLFVSMSGVGTFQAGGATDHVPLVLHQMWKDHDVNKFERWKSTWKLVPGLQHKFYTDKELPALVKQYVPQFYEAWMTMGRPVEKADFSRYAIMYGEGGIYADLDMELLSPRALLELRALNQIILPREEHRVISNEWVGSSFVGQSFMMSPARNVFWLDLMQYIIESYSPDHYETMNTGPDIVTDFLNKRELCLTYSDIRVFEGLIRGPTTRHHQTGVWRTKSAKKRRKTTSHKIVEMNSKAGRCSVHKHTEKINCKGQCFGLCGHFEDGVFRQILSKERELSSVAKDEDDIRCFNLQPP